MPYHPAPRAQSTLVGHLQPFTNDRSQATNSGRIAVSIARTKRMDHSQDALDEESARATEMLQGKTVARVVRHRPGEVMIEFVDGTRVFVDRSEAGVEVSIT